MIDTRGTGPSLLRKLGWNGEWFDRAQEHLKKTGLTRLIETSRSNVLGDAIRDHLSVLYEVDRMGPLGDIGDGEQGMDRNERVKGSSEFILPVGP